ncbi:alpha-ketoglutarate-dependent dioxygenase AlkB family protein [Joostella sp. CR20]|uniref:alpha-ketoglutarate-dependent dioxygenase AlkB family protein n=1 Tax=Joostella sp. CR20 TaxID=2804312 RepID=UPI00313DB970
MDLFDATPPHLRNLLPRDGTVFYYGKIFNQQENENFYITLLKEISWKNDEAIIFGKRIVTKRKVAWYGDEKYPYTYSKTTKFALPWSETLLQLKAKVEAHTGETFNSCLLNLYHDGSEGMAWHSDGEVDLKKDGAIASVTFGATRKFSFKHKETKEKVDVVLENGSLLEMKGTTQTFWLHRLPPTKTVHSPRINLTFRTIEKN